MSEDMDRDRAEGPGRTGRGRRWALWAKVTRKPDPEPQWEEMVPPGGYEGQMPRIQETPPEPTAAHEPQGAFAVLRRGVRESPELRSGFGYTIGLAVLVAGARVLLPILIQQVIDKGINGPNGFDAAFVMGITAIVGGLTVALYFGARVTYRRLVRASEHALYGLRVRTFEHIHELSIGAQNEQKRGAFVARVTADVDILGQFMEWGAVSWFTSPTIMFAAALGMFIYSWQLALIALIAISPLFLVLKRLQRGMLAAYDRVRTRVGDMLTAFSESLMGAAVVRSYGTEEQTNAKVKDAIQRRYRAEIYGNRYQASIFTIADLFGAVAIAAVVVVGATFGARWGLSLGDMVAFLFLITLFLDPLSELSETFDFTQQAIAGWRKVLGVVDTPADVVEPEPGEHLPHVALGVRTEGLEFGYRDGSGLVLRGIDVDIPAGGHIAVVGETGCGKTTFAKLLCRMADPTCGRILLAGFDLREVAAESRRESIRMVPQDGFLFDTTIRENIRYGLEGSTDQDVMASLGSLGLDEWIVSLPDGLETQVGERGDSLSVGERQLVALARAQMASPGLLILDEATSAVDPETERMVGDALERLSEGRTTVTIAHRLSTAEAADAVLVFDRGRIVERGRHAELLAKGGIYARLYQSWLGNTRADLEEERAG
jgi:putative ABC transport system ATP-binding protein